MSANLYWEPVQRKKHDMNVGAPQSFMDTMQRVFGSRTPRLSEQDAIKLETLRDATDNIRVGGSLFGTDRRH